MALPIPFEPLRVLAFGLPRRGAKVARGKASAANALTMKDTKNVKKCEAKD